MNKMNKEMTAYAIEVMQAWLDGKPIEASYIGEDHWWNTENPSWDWISLNYRIKVVKPSINWSHVDKRFKYMAMGANGVTYLLTKKPTLPDEDGDWYVTEDARSVEAIVYASFVPGTCDWRDSLVVRPEGV